MPERSPRLQTAGDRADCFCLFVAVRFPFRCLDMICAPSLGLQGSPRPPEEERADVWLWRLTVFSARWLHVSRTFSGVSAVKNYFHFTVVQRRVTQKSSSANGLITNGARARRFGNIKSRRVYVCMHTKLLTCLCNLKTHIWDDEPKKEKNPSGCINIHSVSIYRATLEQDVENFSSKLNGWILCVGFAGVNANW